MPADQPDKRAALTEFLRAALADWGKMASVTPATVTISEGRDEYVALVGGGDIARLRVSPVLGADGKTGVRLSNLRSVFHDSLMQGVVASASYKGAGTPFSLSGTNGFYNGHCEMKGEL